jgi:Fur family zinc uptake transcriptional regulator
MDIKEAIGYVKQRGHKLTPQRTEILRTLMVAGSSLTAQSVYQRVREIYPNISLDTVYRNLTMLTTTGLVNQVNLQNKGIARFEFQGQQHHHHAVCLICGKSLCVDACPLPENLVVIKQDPHFRIISHAFELYGHCSECQQRHTDAHTAEV